LYGIVFRGNRLCGPLLTMQVLHDKHYGVRGGIRTTRTNALVKCQHRASRGRNQTRAREGELSLSGRHDIDYIAPTEECQAVNTDGRKCLLHRARRVVSNIAP
jgi:hypothetical protein